MSDAAEDFDALFEEISSQSIKAAATPAAAPSTASPAAAEDDLEALFEEVSAHTHPALNAAAPAAATAAEPGDAELEALFEQISASKNAVPAPVAAAAETASLESLSDKPMFDRLGAIVRQLHDSLRELGYDRSLKDVAEQMTDSKGRLEYVASLTEQAANKVLNAIDEGLPAQESLVTKAKDVEQRWADLFAGKLTLEQFKLLANESQQFAGLVGQTADAEKARLMEIMMAQDFQDITGQIIKKIVTISTKLETELAQLLRDNAPSKLQKDKDEEKENKPVDLMSGPAMPNAAMAQDDVDSLLADLGF